MKTRWRHDVFIPDEDLSLVDNPENQYAAVAVFKTVLIFAVICLNYRTFTSFEARVRVQLPGSRNTSSKGKKSLKVE